MEKQPVWVNEQRCKACDICVSVCPSGTLAMVEDENRVLGKIVVVINPQSCIGCDACELSCPDFAITVASKNDVKFAKITPEAKERAEKIKANNFMKI